MCVNSYSTYCLTQAVHLQANDTFQLLTASTDGHIAIWPIVMTETFQRKGRTTPSNQSPPPSSLSEKALSPLQLNKPHTRIKIHQSSIKALMTIHLSPSTILVATGGDDGALAFTRIVINNDLNAPTPPPPHTVQHSTLLIPKAHASAINAITSIGHHTTTTATTTTTTTIPPIIIIVQEKKKKKHAAAAPPPPQPNPKSILRFATAGNDQRLRIWQLLLPLLRTRSDDATCCQQQQENPEMHDCDIARESNAYTSIADVSCMEAYTTEEDGTTRIVIGGIGMESLIYR